jgi:hypothetical protein
MSTHHRQAGRARMARRKAARGLCIGILGAALAGPATTHAAWTPPVDLSAAGQDAFTASLAVDATGRSVIGWHRFDGVADRVEARTRSAAGALGATQSLSTVGQAATQNQVAIDANGKGVLVWLRSNVAEARTITAAGALGPVMALSGFGAAAPQVAVDAAGNAVFVWQQSGGVIQMRTLSAAGVLGVTTAVSAAGQDAFRPQVAMNAAGTAALTWDRSDGAVFRIQARSLSPAGVLSGVRTLSAGGQDAFYAQAAVDVAGDATFTWYRFDGTDARVQARSVSAAGVLSGVRTLSAAGQSAQFPEVGVDANGNALVTWHRSDGVNLRVQSRTVSTAGVMGPLLTLSDAGQSALFPQLAVTPGGDAVLTWYRSDGANNRVQARTHSAAGVLGATSTLSAAGQPAFAPKVGVDANGAAIVTWQRSDGSDSRIQLAAGP